MLPGQIWLDMIILADKVFIYIGIDVSVTSQ